MQKLKNKLCEKYIDMQKLKNSNRFLADDQSQTVEYMYTQWMKPPNHNYCQLL